MQEYQIIIPMSGFGERFRRAGYKIPKPFINIEGLPIIQHVINMFPGEQDFIFICNENHIKNYHIDNILNDICPTGQVISIAEHKLGPIYAVNEVMSKVSDHKQLIINYCDFFVYWHWSKFKEYIDKYNCDGALTCYRGFHPHSLGNTNYAYVRESNRDLIDIQEKKPFTDNRMQEFASSGTYHFKSKRILIDAIKYMFKNKLTINNEYYVSLAYKYLINKDYSTKIYPLQHFFQWGTPEDVSDYTYFSEMFKSIHKQKKYKKTLKHKLIVPAAGLGLRFQKKGYSVIKPLIKVSGKEMIVQSCSNISASEAYVISRKNTLKKNSFDFNFVHKIIELNKPTNGQATTAMLGVKEYLLSNNDNSKIPITITACDTSFTYNQKEFNSLLGTNYDIIVWSIKGYPNSKKFPEMYGWLEECADGSIKKVSVKKPIKNNIENAIVLGTFTFRNAEIYSKCYASLVERNGKVNSEYYIDELVNDAITMGYNCKIFLVDSYLCWGTPADLETFNYWQACFHKWNHHPYTLQSDFMIDKNDCEILVDKYSDQNFSKKEHDQ